MPDRLELTKNAQFYKPVSELSNQVIESILNVATSNIEEGGLFLLNQTRIARQFGQLRYIYSVRVFPSARDVYFFSENIKDRIYSYILLLEFGNYIALFRKSCANINNILNSHFIAIDNNQLTSTLDDSVEFQKLATRVMTMSDKALRAKSYEAADLKGLLSTHAAGRSIPYFLKVRQMGAIKTLNAGTGRIVEIAERSSLDQIALWAKEQIELIKNPSAISEFLSSFASKIDLNEVLAKSKPKAIMLETGAIFDLFNDENIEILYQAKRKRGRKINNKAKVTLLKALEAVCELDANGKASTEKIDVRIRKNKRGLSFASKRLSRYRIRENGLEYTFPRYIISHGWFSVCFDDPKYMYYQGTCFEDKSGISEVDSILKIFHPQDKFNIVLSEKGEFTSNSINFSSRSMFGLVEKLHKDDDYIFCDDLGDEWADHITLNGAKSEICFIHSKHGEVTKSATKFQDVVGQAIKNLGNMFFDASDLIRKHDKTFSKTYNAHKGPQTKINRIRRGNADRLEDFLVNFLQTYNLRRKCILSCSFVSKEEIAGEFKKIKDGSGSVAGNIIQLMWIVSSFAHACREMNVEPIIYCRE